MIEPKTEQVTVEKLREMQMFFLQCNCQSLFCTMGTIVEKCKKESGTRKKRKSTKKRK